MAKLGMAQRAGDVERSAGPPPKPKGERIRQQGRLTDLTMTTFPALKPRVRVAPPHSPGMNHTGYVGCGRHSKWRHRGQGAIRKGTLRACQCSDARNLPGTLVQAAESPHPGSQEDGAGSSEIAETPVVSRPMLPQSSQPQRDARADSGVVFRLNSLPNQALCLWRRSPVLSKPHPQPVAPPLS